MDSFEKFFVSLSGHSSPWPWQTTLASAEICGDRLIRIPTGFGKTLGVLAAWVWHRLLRKQDDWPRRLVWCLPMRVLVEQTEQCVRQALERLGLLWDGRSAHDGRVGVHLLMGGSDSGEWYLYPEHAAVLIGTQDMLLSRALNRGYASPRARWPVEFGLLNQDSLWVMDEVQLMDVGLATSGQLQAFRQDDARAGRAFRPCYTWWMSATLQEAWLAQSPDTRSVLEALQPPVSIPPAQRTGPLWHGVRKTCRREPVKDVKALAALVRTEHVRAGKGAQGPTLVVLNTVERALQVWELLGKDKELKNTDVRLAHSRFRPHERARWTGTFLDAKACHPGTDRILVATQVVEAGVDVSAAVLVTELAPWASLVQRFGRCARWGGEGRVVVADLSPKDDRAAAPYSKAALDAARDALEGLSDVSPLCLEAFEEQHPELLAELYPYEPAHLLLRHELDELFDTSPDLSGADVDISRFIRSGEERDLHVFWTEVPKGSDPDPQIRPSREALCAVPFLKARDWLCGGRGAEKLRPGVRAWVWDWLEGRWRTAGRDDLYPGRTVLVAADVGGYDPQRGWFPEAKDPVPPIPLSQPDPAESADDRQDDESLSAADWQTIGLHGRQTGALASRLAQELVPSLAALMDLAGRWHDVGKAHPAFQNSIVGSGRPDRQDLAKAPAKAWLPVGKLYPVDGGERRPGFRHELASALSLFAVLARHAPGHTAMLGPWKELLQRAGFGSSGQPLQVPPPIAVEQEILALDAPTFDLLAYLVCAHHGKVRLTWHACPADQEAKDGRLRIRGVVEGDILPSVLLAASDGSWQRLPESRLDLAPAAAGLNPSTGAGWTERVLGLLERHGPFALAYLESLLRASDQRASRTAVQDELLQREVVLP